MMPHPVQRKRANSRANAVQMDLIDLLEQMERQDATRTPSDLLMRRTAWRAALAVGVVFWCAVGAWVLA